MVKVGKRNFEYIKIEEQSSHAKPTQNRVRTEEFENFQNKHHFQITQIKEALSLQSFGESQYNPSFFFFFNFI